MQPANIAYNADIGSLICDHMHNQHKDVIDCIIKY